MEGIKCLVLVSGNDEFIPNHVDKERLGSRLVAAMGSTATYEIIDGAGHEAKEHEDAVIQAVMNFVQ
mgnify:CR=1 FL=1